MCSVPGLFGHLGPTGGPLGSWVFSLGTLPGVGSQAQPTFQRPSLPRTQLTALDGVRCSLQGHDSSAGLWDVHPENQPHSRVLPADVRLSFPQLNVCISQLQDSRTVNAARRLKTPFTTEHLSEQERSPTKPPQLGRQKKSTASQGMKLQCTDKVFQPGTYTKRGIKPKGIREIPQGKSLL